MGFELDSNEIARKAAGAKPASVILFVASISVLSYLLARQKLETHTLSSAKSIPSSRFTDSA